MGKFKTWATNLSIVQQVVLAAVGLTIVGVAAANNNAPVPEPTAPPAHTQSSTPKVEKKTVTETQEVPFDSTTVDSSSLAKGKTQISIAGANGIKSLIYEVTYTDGVQSNKQLISQEVITQPITQVTTVGTYVAPVPSCPNGSYINSSGNTVCSPYSSPSAPSGATAKCNDGTYSFSQHHSGTCSHHGGVTQWL